LSTLNGIGSGNSTIYAPKRPLQAIPLVVRGELTCKWVKNIKIGQLLMLATVKVPICKCQIKFRSLMQNATHEHGQI